MATVTVRSQVTIKAAPEAVFEYLSDTNLHYFWNPSIRTISPVGNLKLGSKYDVQSIVLKDIHLTTRNEITRFVEPKSIGIRNQFGTVKYDSLFSLKPVPRGTVVNFYINVLTESRVFGLTLPVLKQLAVRELKLDLLALKVAVETQLGK